MVELQAIFLSFFEFFYTCQKFTKKKKKKKKEEEEGEGEEGKKKKKTAPVIFGLKEVERS